MSNKINSFSNISISVSIENVRHEAGGNDDVNFSLQELGIIRADVSDILSPMSSLHFGKGFMSETSVSVIPSFQSAETFILTPFCCCCDSLLG